MAPQAVAASRALAEDAGLVCAKAFVETVNNPIPDKVRAFETTWGSKSRHAAASVEDRVGRGAELHEQWGSVTLERVVSSSATGAVIVVATEKSGRLEMEFQFGAEGKLDAIMIAPEGQRVESRTLSAADRAAVVNGVAETLKSQYVFPEMGLKMADLIQGRLQSGGYDSITLEDALARRLTDDCRSLSNDKHLRVRLAPKREDEAADDGPTEADRAEARRENYAFRKVEILPGGIGYVRFDAFYHDEEAKAVASAAMNFLSNCDAIIFDLRGNGGGSPEMIRHITSYLFESRTHLNDMVDRDGKVVEEYWTLEHVPGPRPRADIPVYVLTSGRTFSGAEEFSYNLKNLKRATIVGETTGGGAHPVRGERVTDRFMVGVPFMRARNPISQTNWEGTGVAPDVQVPAAEALDRATALAREALAKGRK